MELVITAFVLGLMGSFHCVGMCGPIALSLPLRGTNYSQKLLGGVLYNLGRTIMYGLMGFFFGIIGQGFHMLGFQRWVSIGTGLLLIATIFLPTLFKNLPRTNINFFTGKVRKAIQTLFMTRSYGALFFIGTLNSLLPCGLVYLAIAGAIGIGNLYLGALYMILFGLGTLPLMLMVSFLGNVITLSVRNKINRIIPTMVVVIGIIFVFRGLCLGIPFLSPPMEKLTPSAHLGIHKMVDQQEAVKGSCCHK